MVGISVQAQHDCPSRSHIQQFRFRANSLEVHVLVAMIVIDSVQAQDCATRSIMTEITNASQVPIVVVQFTGHPSTSLRLLVIMLVCPVLQNTYTMSVQVRFWVANATGKLHASSRRFDSVQYS